MIKLPEDDKTPENQEGLFPGIYLNKNNITAIIVEKITENSYRIVIATNVDILVKDINTRNTTFTLEYSSEFAVNNAFTDIENQLEMEV